MESGPFTFSPREKVPEGADEGSATAGRPPAWDEADVRADPLIRPPAHLLRGEKVERIGPSSLVKDSAPSDGAVRRCSGATGARQAGQDLEDGLGDHLEGDGRPGEVDGPRDGLGQHQVDRGERLAGKVVAPSPEVGPDRDDRDAQGVGQAALEARPAVGVGAVEDGHQRVGRAHAVHVEAEDRIGVQRLDRLDLDLRQEDVVPRLGQGGGQPQVPRALGLGEQRPGEVETHAPGPSEKTPIPAPTSQA